MSKRFTETEKWNDPWFRALQPPEKLLFNFLCDRCDMGGFYEIDIGGIVFHTGMEKGTIEGALKGLARAFETNGDFLWIRNFLSHQKNLPLNPENKAHKAIIACISKRLSQFPDIPKKIGASKGLFSPTGIGIGKGQVKYLPVSKASDPFNLFWYAYPNKQGKAKAWKYWQRFGCDEIICTIMDKLVEFKKSVGWLHDDGDFIPHGDTWVFNKKWEDDPNTKEEFKGGAITGGS